MKLRILAVAAVLAWTAAGRALTAEIPPTADPTEIHGQILQMEERLGDLRAREAELKASVDRTGADRARKAGDTLEADRLDREAADLEEDARDMKESMGLRVRIDAARSGGRAEEAEKLSDRSRELDRKAFQRRMLRDLTTHADRLRQIKRFLLMGMERMGNEPKPDGAGRTVWDPAVRREAVLETVRWVDGMIDDADRIEAAGQKGDKALMEKLLKASEKKKRKLAELLEKALPPPPGAKGFGPRPPGGGDGMEGHGPLGDGPLPDTPPMGPGPFGPGAP